METDPNATHGMKVDLENVQGREEVLDIELGKEERKKLFEELQIETLDIESIRELDCEILKEEVQ